MLSVLAYKTFRFGGEANNAWKEHPMTDSTNESGTTPEPTGDAVAPTASGAFEVNASGDAVAPAAAEPSAPVAAQPAAAPAAPDVPVVPVAPVAPVAPAAQVQTPTPPPVPEVPAAPTAAPNVAPTAAAAPQQPVEPQQPAAPQAPVAPTEAAAPVAPVAAAPVAPVAPAAPVASGQHAQPVQHAQHAQHAQPAQHAHPAAPIGATAAYPTDAFGRPLYAGATPDAHGAPAPYATENGYPAAPIPPAKKDPARRKGTTALIAALAIGAILGGASGAGVVSLINSNQSSSVPANQSQGASNIVVNNTQSVNEVTAVAAKAAPSVVTINVTTSSAGGTGSGVILTADGYILTNTHVVTLDGASANGTVKVTTNDGRIFDAKVVGTDPISDLAVIKLVNASGLTPMVWADSSKLNVGDSTVAIGAPLGLSGTVTTGIISALNRSITVASSAAPTSPDTTTPTPNNQGGPFNYYFDQGNGSQAPTAASSSISLPVIQTDAAINPGNSGGALLNGKGELIGINVAIANASSSSSSGTAGSIGVGFALPSDLAKRISEELISTGKATHGLLGASVGDAASVASSTTVGALVSAVTGGGPAASAGLAKGDIITNFNGAPITDATDLTAQVRSLAAGSKAELTYVRDGKATTVSVTLGSLSS